MILILITKKKMLKSFINAKTGEKVRVIASKEPTKKELEEQL
jgi:hypothetical protein